MMPLKPAETPSLDPTRRGFLAGLVASSALLTAAPALALEALLEGSHLPGASAALAASFTWLRAGVGVVDDWAITASRLEGGAVVLEVARASGDTFRLDICRRDASGDSGLETTRLFDLRLMNEGAGAQGTIPAHHQPTRIIAEVLRRSESDLSEAPAELLPHAARLALFEAEALRHPAPA